MTYQLYIIDPEGKVTSKDQKKAPDLKQMQSIVGGSIQMVPHLTKYRGHSRGIAFANEEGILLGLPFNKVATRMWLDNLGKGPFRYEPELFGTVLYYAKVKEAKK